MTFNEYKSIGSRPSQSATQIVSDVPTIYKKMTEYETETSRVQIPPTDSTRLWYANKVYYLSNNAYDIVLKIP